MYKFWHIQALYYKIIYETFLNQSLMTQELFKEQNRSNWSYELIRTKKKYTIYYIVYSKSEIRLPSFLSLLSSPIFNLASFDISKDHIWSVSGSFVQHKLQFVHQILQIGKNNIWTIILYKVHWFYEMVLYVLSC